MVVRAVKDPPNPSKTGTQSFTSTAQVVLEYKSPATCGRAC